MKRSVLFVVLALIMATSGVFLACGGGGGGGGGERLERLYFTADDGSGRSNEIWSTDGTASGTTILVDLNASGGSYPEMLEVYKGRLYFKADDGSGRGDEMWSTDGTANGTTILVDLNPSAGSWPSWMTSLGGLMYFAADDGSGRGQALWSTDGSAGGTTLVVEIGNLFCLTPFGTNLYFFGDDGSGRGWELWATDGTAGGTTLIVDLNPAGDTAIATMEVYGVNLYFGLLNDTRLWTSDGTASGTTVAFDLNAVGINDEPMDLHTYNGLMYFSGPGPGGRELWSTDGTAIGTTLVVDINPGGSSWAGFGIQGFGEFNGLLYFNADDGTSRGEELWVTDGSASGTTLAVDLNSNLT